MKMIYPAIFHSEDGAYWVEFPDLPGCQSYGDSIADTIENAREAPEVYAISFIESNKKLPPATDISKIDIKDGTFASLVDIDLSAYFKKAKAVKKTLTIPEWLNEAAMQKGINFSQTLQDALMAKISQ